MTDTKTKWGNTLPGKGDWTLYDDEGIMVFSRLDCADDLSDEDSPIPLTPEVMERIEEVENNWIECGDVDIVIGKTPTKVILIGIREGDHLVYLGSIKHLHHLQQLYRLLTGKELAIDWA